MSKDREFILRNLSRIKRFTLGTIDDDGRPWVVELKLAFDENLHIIWHSKKGTEHSKHIAARPDVAICMADDFDDIGDFGLYARARAYEITDEAELAEKLAIRSHHINRPLPLPAAYLGGSPDRLYCAVINEAWVNDQSKIKRRVI